MDSGSSARVDIEIDLTRLSSKFDKVLRILHKECPALVDAYMISVVLVAYFEECEGVELSPETLCKLRAGFAEFRKSF